MNKPLLCTLVALMGNCIYAQSPACFSSPDGLDGNSWSYKDYIIPAGYRLDSGTSQQPAQVIPQARKILSSSTALEQVHTTRV